MDAYWKSYQNAYLKILQRIENNTLHDKSADAVNLIAEWSKNYHSLDFIFVMPLPSVMLPHLFILLLGSYLAWKHPPSDITSANTVEQTALN